MVKGCESEKCDERNTGKQGKSRDANVSSVTAKQLPASPGHHLQQEQQLAELQHHHREQLQVKF